MMDEVREKRKISLLIFLLSFAISAIFMPIHLLYDEFWTLLYFVPLDIFQILTDLSLPNNHPLNTLMMKIFSSFSGIEAVLRLPSLLCGAAVPVLCGQLAYKWSRSNQRAAMLSAAVLAIFSAPLVVYNGLARGYAMQQFFLLLCVWAMTGVKENPRRAAIWMTIGAVGTFLSVPTGALFLLPAAAGFLIYASPEVRKNREMWIAAGIIAVSGGLFYGINFSALQSGQDWGNKLDTAAGFWVFLQTTSVALAGTPVLLAALPAFIRPVKRLAALGLLLLPLLLSIFTNGGPDRCYLYLAAALAVAGGIGLGELTAKFRYSQIIPVMASAVLGIGGFVLQYSHWRQTDHIQCFYEIRQELPVGVMPVFRSTAGFPVLCGITEEELTELNSQMFGGNFSRIAVFECEDGVFNGLDSKMSENIITVPGISGESCMAGGLPCRIYDIHPAESVSAGDCCLVILPPGEKLLPEIMEKHGSMLYLNAWLTKYGRIAVFKCDTPPDIPPGNWKIYHVGRK